MSLLVEIKDKKKPHMLCDMSANQVVEADRPCVVRKTAFITQRIGLSQLTVLADNVPNEVTDLDFLAEYKKDPKAAIAKYTAKPEPEKKP